MVHQPSFVFCCVRGYRPLWTKGEGPPAPAQFFRGFRVSGHLEEFIQLVFRTAYEAFAQEDVFVVMAVGPKEQVAGVQRQVGEEMRDGCGALTFGLVGVDMTQVARVEMNSRGLCVCLCVQWGEGEGWGRSVSFSQSFVGGGGGGVRSCGKAWGGDK